MIFRLKDKFAIYEADMKLLRFSNSRDFLFVRAFGDHVDLFTGGSLWAPEETFKDYKICEVICGFEI